MGSRQRIIRRKYPCVPRNPARRRSPQKAPPGAGRMARCSQRL